MITAFSLDPYPSKIGQPYRRLNDAMSRADASDPKPHFNWLSASPGVGGTATM